MAVWPVAPHIKDFLGTVSPFHFPWRLESAAQLETMHVGKLWNKASGRAVAWGRR